MGNTTLDKDTFLDLKISPQQRLRSIAKFFERAPRSSDGKDVPEGTVTVVCSDTSIQIIVVELFYAASQVDEMAIRIESSNFT